MAKIRAQTEAGRAAQNFTQEAQKLGAELNMAMRGIAEDAELIYAAHALKKTGRMSRGITSKVAGNVALVEVHAKDPKSGFDYVAVTRFGHRKLKIVPKHPPKKGRYLAPIPNVGPRWVNKRAALGPIPGIGFRASVRGFKPKGDWADKALPQVKTAAEREMVKLGGRILVRLAS